MDATTPQAMHCPKSEAYRIEALYTPACDEPAIAFASNAADARTRRDEMGGRHVTRVEEWNGDAYQPARL